VICVDGDALLDEHAVTWMARALTLGPRVGGVTGNPRIRTRSTALGRLQLGEFSSLVGLIKRAQMVWGRLFPSPREGAGDPVPSGSSSRTRIR
jgi:poly-beta-1,6-N-acetyl-D-glucosamine synthase